MFELSTFSFSQEVKNQFVDIIFDPQDSKEIIVSNTQGNAPIYAPEINWYLKNSLADELTKLQNVQRMFENRLAIYDNAPYKEYTLPVDSTLLLIGNENTLLQDFQIRAQEADFKCKILSPEAITTISGEIGNFKALLKDESEVSFSQAVLFIQDENLPKFLGIVSIQDFHNAQEILTLLQSRLGTYTYKTTTLYSPNLCQYHHRRPQQNGEGFCHKCVNVCPSFGVGKDDSLMELVFSQVDCKGCGGCIATCPSGALDFAPYSLDCLSQALQSYKNTQILLIPENFLDLLEEVKIPSHLSPLIIPREKFPSEVHFLSFLQESGNSMIFFSPVISRPSLEAIQLINDIYQAIYSLDAIFVAQDLSALQTLWDKPQPIVQYSYFPSPNEARRKHFSERLRFMIKDQDFGNVKSGESGELIRYGKIHINADKCTLCNSCVGACNVDSLTANPHKLALQYNPSLCTTCGYCVSSCPEDALRLSLSGIELNPQWFEEQVLAQDTLFECEMCHKPFATSKSIAKIDSLMREHFASDPIKLKSLHCCSDCKVKLIFGD